MKKLFKKFFFGAIEWLANTADHIKLFVIWSRIESLNKKLDWERDFGLMGDPKDLEKLIVWSEAHNIVLLRIRARSARNQRIMSKNEPIILKLRFEYRGGVWWKTTQNTQMK
jgi:hypothetical protein